MQTSFSLIDTDKFENFLSRMERLASQNSQTKPRDTLDDLVILEDAAVILGISRYTLYSKRKEISHMKKGRRCYFSRKVLAAYLLTTSKVEKGTLI